MRRFIFLAMALASVAFADKVTLKDGRAYEGVVLEETETTVKIKTAKTTLTLQKDQVASIDKVAGGALQERETRLAALDPAKPRGYLDLATWLCGSGSDAYDLPTVRHLCAAASKLDATLAFEAQMLAGKKLEEAGMRRDAAMAYARALLAKPGDKEPRARLESLKQGLHDDASKEMQQLYDALEQAAKGNFAEALPLLQKTGWLAMSEKANETIGMSIEALTRNVASRVHCKTCGGTGEASCRICEGDGLLVCSACGGSGNKKGFVAGKDQGGICGKVCRSCYGLGTILCTRCKAERDIIIQYWWDKGDYNTAAVVHAKAGAEGEALKTEIDVTSYTQKTKGWIVVGIKGDLPTAGGRGPCATCLGVKFDPPKEDLPVGKIRGYMSDIRDCIDGHKTYDCVPAVSEPFDASVLADGLKYSNGKWVK